MQTQAEWNTISCGVKTFVHMSLCTCVCVHICMRCMAVGRKHICWLTVVERGRDQERALTDSCTMGATSPSATQLMVELHMNMHLIGRRERERGKHCDIVLWVQHNNNKKQEIKSRVKLFTKSPVSSFCLALRL